MSALTFASCATPANHTRQDALEPTPTASATPPAQSDLLPAETILQHDGWAYTIGPVQWDQRDRVRAANPNITNVPPAGYGWAIIRVSITNTSRETAAQGMFEVVLHAGGWHVSHHTEREYAFRIPDAYEPHDIDHGESISGNLGFWVPDYAATTTDCRVELRTKTSYLAEPESVWFACER